MKWRFIPSVLGGKPCYELQRGSFFLFFWIWRFNSYVLPEDYKTVKAHLKKGCKYIEEEAADTN